MISLRFQKPHRSITGLEGISLPDFTVITGVNGSGKSHLLEAILNGGVAVEGIKPNQPSQPGSKANQEETEIRLFNWSNFVPGNNTTADPIALGKSREDLLTKTRADFIAGYRGFKVEISKLNLPTLPSRLLGLSKEEFDAVIGAQSSNENAKWTTFNNLVRGLAGSLGDNKSLIGRFIELVDKTSNKPEALTLQEIDVIIPVSPFPKDAFQQDFSQIFATYHRLWEKNRYAQFLNAEFKEKNRVRTEDEFRRDYGEPPWDLVNRVLNEAHLDYRVNSPVGTSAERPFNARLINKTNPSAAVSFQDLSSGEKILMSLAICLYNASDRRLRYPKLMLLDEIDAPLHPSMTKDLIRIIERVLVGENNVKVIMTTHSPATVAFSPDAALFQLNKQPRSLDPCLRERAIQTLSRGFISVTEGSRFVITEAKLDRVAYSAIAQKLIERGKMESVPNLIFVQASDKKDEKGGGRAQVQNWGTKLPAAGLTQILGLIDRDLGNVASAGIRVIGRHSLENYLVDPIIMYAVLMHDGKHQEVLDVGLKDGNYFELSNADQEVLQRISDAVCSCIESHQPQVKAASGMLNVEYVCGKRVSVPAWLRECRGHDLITAVRETFRSVVGPGYIITRNDCADLVDMISERLPDFIPQDLLQVFKELQIA